MINFIWLALVIAFFVLVGSGYAEATAIVGLVHDSVVYIGGDSAGVAGLSITVRADEKVFKIDDRFVVGFTTSFRMGQLLRYRCEIPKQDENQSVEKYMATTFVDSVRICFERGGFSSKVWGKETGGTFLVGYKGRLFTVDGDFQVGESLDKYDAIGSGFDLVLGSMYSTEGLSPRERIIKALEAAEKFNAGVRRPFHVIELRDHTLVYP